MLSADRKAGNLAETMALLKVFLMAGVMVHDSVGVLGCKTVALKELHLESPRVPKMVDLSVGLTDSSTVRKMETR